MSSKSWYLMAGRYVALIAPIANFETPETWTTRFSLFPRLLQIHAGDDREGLDCPKGGYVTSRFGLYSNFLFPATLTVQSRITVVQEGVFNPRSTLEHYIYPTTSLIILFSSPMSIRRSNHLLRSVLSASKVSVRPTIL